jgi:hypothetical protein
VKVVSRWTKIPITTLDQEEDNLINLVDKLHDRVVGQDEAVNLVAQEVLRSRVGFCQSDQPIGSFLFLGPAGVGKTELAKALAEKLFDNEKTLVRFDMSEYADSGSVSRLIGGSRRFGLYTFCTFIPFQHFIIISHLFLKKSKAMKKKDNSPRKSGANHIVLFFLTRLIRQIPQ